MNTTIFPCQDLAQSLQAQVAEKARLFHSAHGRSPSLHVVLVGEDPASRVYVRNKTLAAKSAGISAHDHILPEQTTQKELLALVEKLNQDGKVDGILVQSPLPSGLNESLIQAAINPQKDVDGFHPQNMGALALDAKSALQNSLVPCTPAGVLEVLAANHISVAGKHAVVIGRSNIVGKPMALMLLAQDATVSICHSRTKNLTELTKQADIIVAAVGKANFLQGSQIKKGAVVIDVGINRSPGKNGKASLCGDCDLESMQDIASFITPVPKGIGPLTIAMLLRNTLRAAEARARLARG